MVLPSTGLRQNWVAGRGGEMYEGAGVVGVGETGGTWVFLGCRSCLVLSGWGHRGDSLCFFLRCRCCGKPQDRVHAKTANLLCSLAPSSSSSLFSEASHSSSLYHSQYHLFSSILTPLFLYSAFLSFTSHLHSQVFNLHLHCPISPILPLFLLCPSICHVLSFCCVSSAVSVVLFLLQVGQIFKYPTTRL